MKFLKLVMISLIVNSCAGVDIPLVTFVQMDTIHNRANPKRVTKYNEKTCKIETVADPSYPIILEDGSINRKFHGGFWLSKEDMNALYECGEAECRKELQRIMELQNAKATTKY